MQPEEIRVNGLGLLDVKELEALLKDNVRRDTPPDYASGRYGDLSAATTIIIVLAPHVLNVLLPWLLKKRTKKLLEFESERKLTDGTILKEKIRLEINSEDELDAKTLESLKSITGKSADEIKQALKTK